LVSAVILSKIILSRPPRPKKPKMSIPFRE
jgi:hypothetical protein